VNAARPPPDPALRAAPPSPQGGGMKGEPPVPIPPPCGGGPERSEGGGGRSTVERARFLRRSMTRYEVKLWLRLRELNAQGFRFRRQAPIERWIVDFACFSNRIIVEVDGMQHGFEPQAKRDDARDDLLTRSGFLVLRFTNGEVWENIDGVVATIFSRRSKFAAAKSDDPGSAALLPPDAPLCVGPSSPRTSGTRSAP